MNAEYGIDRPTTRRGAELMVRALAEGAEIARVFAGVGNFCEEPYVQYTFSVGFCFVTFAPDGDRNEQSKSYRTIEMACV